MTVEQAGTLDPREVLGIEPHRLPRHIAIIMDGNGRWAQQRGLPRAHGHQVGVGTVKKITTTCAKLGIGYLTLYSFSLENWQRPREEVEALMNLCAAYLAQERPTLMENNIRLLHVGRREGLPDFVLSELDRTMAATAANTGLTLCLAINYGGRAEIVDAVRKLAAEVQQGRLAPEEIDEGKFAAALYTAGIPDPDLLIRTAGEMRVSNFLLWQISYAELHVTKVLWPDFTEQDLFAAIRDYASRERKFGRVGRQT